MDGIPPSLAGFMNVNPEIVRAFLESIPGSWLMTVIGAAVTLLGFHLCEEDNNKRNFTVLAGMIGAGLAWTFVIEWLYPGQAGKYLKSLIVETVFSIDVVALTLLAISQKDIFSRMMIILMTWSSITRSQGIFWAGGTRDLGSANFVIALILIFMLAKGGFQLLHEAHTGKHETGDSFLLRLIPQRVRELFPPHVRKVIRTTLLLTVLAADAIPLAKSIVMITPITISANWFANGSITALLPIGGDFKKRFPIIGYGLGFLLLAGVISMTIHELEHLMHVQVPHWAHIAAKGTEIFAYTSIGLAFPITWIQNKFSKKSPVHAHSDAHAPAIAAGEREVA